MERIFVGDNGTVLTMTVNDEKGVVDLTTASLITAKFIRADKTTFDKKLSVENSTAGKCTATLTSADLTVPGTYVFQVTVNFMDGKVFAGLPERFPVRDRL